MMPYAQWNYTDEEWVRIEIITHPAYEVGFREGYDMALAKYGIKEED